MTTTTPGATTKSPLDFTRAALEVARAAVARYSSARSRHDYTQHQRVALLALKLFLKTDDRGLVAQVRDWSDLRVALGLARVPHFTTLQTAHARLKNRRRPPECDRPGVPGGGRRDRARRPPGRPPPGCGSTPSRPTPRTTTPPAGGSPASGRP